MTDAEIIAKVNDVLVEEFELSEAELVRGAELRGDLGLDSLDAVDLIVTLEIAFEMKIGKDERVKAVRTLGDLYDFVLLKRDELAGTEQPK